MQPSIERANKQLDLRQQLANTPSPQSTTQGLHPVSIHQMVPPKWTSDCSFLLIYRPQKDERLSWPSWLTYSGRFTHIVVTQDFTLGDTEAERRRCENRGAEGAEGWELRRGVPLPNQLGGPEERRELPQWGPGRSPSRQRIFWHI